MEKKRNEVAHDALKLKADIIPTWEKIVNYFKETNPEMTFDFEAVEKFQFLEIFESVRILIKEDTKK